MLEIIKEIFNNDIYFFKGIELKYFNLIIQFIKNPNQLIKERYILIITEKIR